MTKQCQHLTSIKSHIILHLLLKFEDLFDDMLGTWKKTPVDFESKDESKPVFSWPYPVSK